MNIIVEYDSNWTDITNDICSNVSLEYRIDEVLNSGSFDFVSSLIDKNIPPFTKLIINNNDAKEYYFCSSESKLIVGDKNQRYIHSMTLVEPTKILETYLVGSKSFSVIANKTISNGLNYNQNYTRMFILAELMKQKYKVEFNFSDRVKQMTLEREYSFGSGTSLFDCLLEIMKSEHCIPQISSFNEDLSIDSYLIDCIDIESLKASEIVYFDNYSGLNYLQSVDDYCNFVETEMSSVVDRDSVQKVLLTCSSSGTNVISNDTACLETPSQIESVKSISLVVDGYSGFTFYVGKTYAISPGTFGTENIQEVDLRSFLQDRVLKTDDMHVYNAYIIDLITNNTSISVDDFAITLCLVQRCFLNGEFNGYLVTIKSNETLAYIDFSNSILEKTNFDLLNENDKPKYCYFTTGSNVIANLYSFGHDSFWDSVIYGEIKPVLWHVLNALGSSPQIDFLEKATNYTSDIYYMNSYACANAGNTSYNPRDYTFKVEYYTKSPFSAKVEKTLKPSNQAEFKNISKSYNNGANTIDFNLVLFGMQKASNLLGLMQTSIISRQDLKVGLKTDKGYIIKKNSSFRIINNEVANLEIEYNLCDNYNQIAEVIGVATQYEATNLPQNNIINRYISNELILADAFFKYLRDNSTNTMFLININTNSTNHLKPVQVLNTSDSIYLVCECVDNYTFDYKKEKFDDNYYVKKPISISDNDNFIESCFISIHELTQANVDKDTLNELPSVSDIGKFQTIRDSSSCLLYKDPREKLVFCINVKSDNDESSSLASKVYITTFTGVSSYKLDRISSNLGSLGTLYNGSTIFYGDLISLTFDIKKGFDYADSCPRFRTIFVSTFDVEIELFTILKSIQLSVDYNDDYINLNIDRYKSIYAATGIINNYATLFIDDGVNLTATAKPNCFIINDGAYATTWSRSLFLNESNFDSYGRAINYSIAHYVCNVENTLEVLSYIYDMSSNTYSLRVKITNKLPFAATLDSIIFIKTTNNTLFSSSKYLAAGENYEWYENDIRSLDLAVRTAYSGNNLTNLSDYIDVPIPHRVYVSMSDGVQNYTISRTYSTAVATGEITSGDYIYSGDTLVISYTCKAGYDYSELSPKTQTIQVTNSDIIVELSPTLATILLTAEYDSSTTDLVVTRTESEVGDTGVFSLPLILYYGDRFKVEFTAKKGNYIFIEPNTYLGSLSDEQYLGSSYFGEGADKEIVYEVKTREIEESYTIDNWNFMYNSSNNTYSLLCRFANNNAFKVNLECTISTIAGSVLFSKNIELEARAYSEDWYVSDIEANQVVVRATFRGDEQIDGLYDERVIS